MQKKSSVLKMLMYISILLILVSLGLIILPDRSDQISNEYLLNYTLTGFILNVFFGFVYNCRKFLMLNLICAVLIASHLKSTNIEIIQIPDLKDNQSVNLVEINLNEVENPESIANLLNNRLINVLVFQQCDPNWDYNLSMILNDKFPFNVKLIQLHPNGTAIFSKLPLTSSDTFMISSFPALKTSIIVNPGKDTISIMSAYIPSNSEVAEQEIIDQSYDELANYVKNFSSKSIVVGQFNQTYWSQNIVHLKNTLNLNNSRRIIYPIISIMPHDHIFYTSDLQCYAFSEVLNKSRVRIGSKAYFVTDKMYE